MINYLKKEIIIFYLSITYYTRLYIPFINLNNYNYLKKTIKYLPLVGILIGIFNLIVYYLTFFLFSDPLICSFFMLIAYIFLTGAFHEDGLADVFDAFGGGYNKHTILTILKDSRIGIYGTLALIFSIILRIIFYWKNINQNLYVIILTPFFSRVYPLLSVKFYNYVNSDIDTSKTKIDKNTISYPLIIFYFLLISIPLYYIKTTLIFTIIINSITWYLMMNYFYRKINGYRGDCLGAIQQVSEIIFLITYYLISK